MKLATKKRILAAAVACSALLLGGCSTTTTPQMPDVLKVQNVKDAEHVITVTGRETVKAVPDMAQITYTIETRESTAVSCQEKNARDLDAALESLKAMGVAETSIQTSSYGLNPIYDWKSSTQRISGYEMSTTLTVSDIPIDQAGKIITQSVAAGVNGINSVDYFCSDYDTNYQDALKAALAMAQEKAEALAAASGEQLDGIVHVEEYGYAPSTRYSAFQNGAAASMMAKEEAAGADMAVMPGQVSIEAQVTVDFKLAD